MRKLLALLIIGTLFVSACGGTPDNEKETEEIATGTVTGITKGQLTKMSTFTHDILFIQTESGSTIRFFDYDDEIIGKAKKGDKVTVAYNPANYHSTTYEKEHVDKDGFLRGKRTYVVKWYEIKGIKFLDK